METYSYFIRVNLVLVVLGLFYWVFLRHDTFFRLRRFILWLMILFAFLYPWINLSHCLSSDYLTFFQPVEVWVASDSIIPEKIVDKGVNLWSMIYGTGVLFLGSRLLIQLLAVVRLRKTGKKRICMGIEVTECEKSVPPFSFFHWIFWEAGTYSQEQSQEILIHEHAHVRQWHSLDILLGEFLCILFWYNPVVWLWRKAIRQNLEFLADRYVLDSGYDRKAYQYHLIRLTCPGGWGVLGNGFNVSQLKRRVRMMNKRKTSLWNSVKYIVGIPVLCLGLLWWNSTSLKADVRELEEMLHIKSQKWVFPEQRPLKDATIVINGKIMPKGYDISRIEAENVESISVIKDRYDQLLYGVLDGGGVIKINTKHDFKQSPENFVLNK